MAADDLSRYQQIIWRPRITEKGTAQQERDNIYHFMVSPRANKVDIKRAIEKLFGVKVISVNTMVRRGKRRRLGLSTGRKRDWKKALVKIEEGQTIEFI